MCSDFKPAELERRQSQQRQTSARFAGLALTARSIRSDQARRSAKARHLIPARVVCKSSVCMRGVRMRHRRWGTECESALFLSRFLSLILFHFLHYYATIESRRVSSRILAPPKCKQRDLSTQIATMIAR